MSLVYEYKGYKASVKYDAEDNIYVGEVLDIKDSLNFHGCSVSEAEKMFRQSVDNYIEYLAR